MSEFGRAQNSAGSLCTPIVLFCAYFYVLRVKEILNSRLFLKKYVVYNSEWEVVDITCLTLLRRNIGCSALCGGPTPSKDIEESEVR